MQGRHLLFWERHKERSQQKTCRGWQMCSSHQQLQGLVGVDRMEKFNVNLGKTGKWMLTVSLVPPGPTSNIVYPWSSSSGYTLGLLVLADSHSRDYVSHYTEGLPFTFFQQYMGKGFLLFEGPPISPNQPLMCMLYLFCLKIWLWIFKKCMESDVIADIQMTTMKHIHNLK